MRPTTSGTRDPAPTAPTIPFSYTPGPWHEHTHLQIGPDKIVVCKVLSAPALGDTAIHQAAAANVRLIAAAPELHQACAAAEALLTRQKWVASEFALEGAVLTALRAVLAKVEGGAA